MAARGDVPGGAAAEKVAGRCDRHHPGTNKELPMSTVALAPSTQHDSMFIGVRAMAPMLLAYSPYALVIGSAVARIDDPVAGWSGSWIIYGGSAHLAALKGISEGAFASA